MIADLLLLDGKWFSPENSSPRLGGLAIGGGRIIARGPDRALRDLRGPATRIIDLAGRLVVPGFHDAHIHVSEGGLSLLEVDCRGVRSAEELAVRAAARARERGPGVWVTGRGWDQREFHVERWPDRGPLDRAAPGNPVLLRRVDGHAALCNGAALAAAGISSSTDDPPGGRIGRDASGAPDGLLLETAIELVRQRIPAPSFEDRKAGLRAALQRAREAGLTSVQDEKGWLDVYAALAASGELTARATVWGRLATPLDELREWRDSFARLFPPELEAGLGRVRPGLLKGYLDGSLGSRTALFFEPYADDPSTAGMATLDVAETRERVIAADAAGFQVGLHAIGDRAVSTALDLYAAARARNGARDSRHRVEHAQNIRRADVARFASLEVVASMQPSHCAGDFGMVRARLGAARISGAYPWRSLLHAGAAVAFGSDFPVESMDPRTSIYAALTRLGWDGAGEPIGAIGPDERLTVAEAIDGFTRGAALAAFAESFMGTLGEGMAADIVILGADLFSIPARDALHAPIDATIVGGRSVWERPGAAL